MLNFDFSLSHDALYCCIKYSNIGCQDEIFNFSFFNKSGAQKKTAQFGFGCEFHDHKYFELELFLFIFVEFVMNLRLSSKSILMSSYCTQILDNYFSNITIHLLAHHLQHPQKYVNFILIFLKINCLTL